MLADSDNVTIQLSAAENTANTANGALAHAVTRAQLLTSRPTQAM